jgi:hypothetical protein
MTFDHRRTWPTESERAVSNARIYCEQLEKMPEAAGYLPAPISPDRARSRYMTPQSLRRDVEDHICECAMEGNHEALAIYRDHGVPLAIFERYDSFLDDLALYDSSPQTILYSKVSFPNPLKPLGAAILGYGRKFPKSDKEPLISKEDFVETMNVLRSMGGHRYISKPQYVAMMFKDMYLNQFVGHNNKDKMVEAMSHFLESGGVSLSRDVDSELTYDQSITKCLATISRLEKKPWFHNPILDYAMDAEATRGVRDFDPALVFSRFLRALKNGRPEEVTHLRDTTPLRAICSSLHEMSPLERTPTEIIMGRGTDFTPLRLLTAIEQSSPRKDEPNLKERLFDVALTAGVDILTADPKHMMNLIRYYQRGFSPSLTDHVGFNTELKKCVGSLSLDAAIKLASNSFEDAREIILAHGKQLIIADKQGELAAANEKTIQILFKSMNGEAFREALGLELKDAFLNKCKLTRSMSFRADSFSKDLGL